MNILEIIQRKKRGERLSGDMIRYWIQHYLSGDIPDYQVSALLMAICLQGMDHKETAELTGAMVRSGQQADLSAIPGITVDKHSTGGVADSTTLIVAPLVAACGVPVAKMSGRGLGHTGGTLDKLESIPGMRVEMPLEEMVNQVKQIGLAIVGQTGEFVPADKRLYALRDVTATVDSLPLIASSIISKKLACGCQAIVLDVKCGHGAFMPDVASAFALAREMVALGHAAGRRMVACVSNMNQPLGRAIGNGLEVYEAVGLLSGEMQGDLWEVCLCLGAQMLILGGAAKEERQAKSMLTDACKSGRGLAKFREMVKSQGGDVRLIDQPERLIEGVRVQPVISMKEGYIQDMDCMALGEIARALGAGRLSKDDVIDPRVGLWLHIRRGERIQTGQTVADIYAQDHVHIEQIVQQVRNAITIVPEQPLPEPLIHGLVTG